MTATLKFYFDPLCPWAWRTSLWIREVRKQQPLNIEWDFFSLRIQNHKPGENDEYWKNANDSHPIMQIMALLRRRYSAEEANNLIDRLYLEAGQALHDRKERIAEPEVLKVILGKLELPESLLDEALSDSTTLDDVRCSHQEAVALGSFGVPALIQPGQAKTIFGPVISEVPTGETALKLWENVSWMMQQDYFFELKKTR